MEYMPDWWGGAKIAVLAFPLILSGTVTLVMLWVFLTHLREVALDAPNHRSLHEVAVPRTGGVAVLAGVFVGILIAGVQISVGVFAAFFSLLSVSLFDDFRSLSARIRFVVQTLSVSLLFYSLRLELHFWFLWPLLVVTGVWVVNLYNFMDGMDGFAGGVTCIGFFSLGSVFFIKGAEQLAYFCYLIAASSAIFLYYNWPRARIFLGDAGSTTIGLAVFSLSVAGWQQGVLNLAVPLMIFLPFWLDATATLLVRVVKRERWWEAHRQHFYQRMAMKFGVRKSLFIELCIMFCTSTITLLLVVFGLV
ncbi:glycosyltransferase family 4 protein [Microbulbifer bruguierae]|uniref:Glycosyltransferase family 4 protein n=1 Tax=Microbulbifer bruguierae TaxID=3029061 RepID=A0ABY8NCX9_9GAMM|nr:glycosyltransferase family 4 protein [Microbulbifer bruguierae]WGL16784.1 glycosyltransferase family 4 protein [Microbulbifer bruguierae]